MMPVRNSSMFDVSVEVSSIVMAYTEGVEIHDRGPSEVEYPCITLDMFPSRSCFVVLVCAMGESCLLENVSGVTCSFPGICLTLNLYIIDLSLKFIILGLGMAASSCLLLRIERRSL